MTLEAAKPLEHHTQTTGSTAGEDLQAVVRNFLTPLKLIVSIAVRAGQQIAHAAQDRKPPSEPTKKHAS
jgi:hypothetical protein